MTLTAAPTTYLWYPGWPLYRLPGDYEALLGPTGWVGLRNTSKVECLRIASADRPLALGPRLCSQAVPLISADGRRAILVQAGRVRVYDAWSGWQMGVAQLPAITWSPGRREVHPVAWESADSYLVNARYGGALALVRCSVSTNRCQRVVRSYVRDGVSGIVTLDGD